MTFSIAKKQLRLSVPVRMCHTASCWHHLVKHTHRDNYFDVEGSTFQSVCTVHWSHYPKHQQIKFIKLICSNDSTGSHRSEASARAVIFSLCEWKLSPLSLSALSVFSSVRLLGEKEKERGALSAGAHCLCRCGRFDSFRHCWCCCYKYLFHRRCLMRSETLWLL